MLPQSAFCCVFSFFNDTATTEIYTLSLHDALPIWWSWSEPARNPLQGGEDQGGGGRAWVLMAHTACAQVGGPPLPGLERYRGPHPLLGGLPGSRRRRHQRPSRLDLAGEGRRGRGERVDDGLVALGSGTQPLDCGQSRPQRGQQLRGIDLAVLA